MTMVMSDTAIAMPTTALAVANEHTQQHIGQLEHAAAQIQRWWRKYHHLMHKQSTSEEEAVAKFRLERAAARIQRWWRKCHTFLHIKPIMQSNDAAEIRLQKAAARIQRWWRKYYHECVKQNSASVCQSVSPIANSVPSLSSSGIAVESAAASRIQRWWRNTPRDECPCSNQKVSNANSLARRVELQSTWDNGDVTVDHAARRIQHWWRTKIQANENITNCNSVVSKVNSTSFDAEDGFNDSLKNFPASASIDFNAAACRIQRWWRKRSNGQCVC